jgi:hypothetical protein
MPHTHLAWPNSSQIQNNACSDAANSGTLAGGVAQCQTQENACNEAASSSKKRAALDFGSCSDPSIEFATGLPGVFTPPSCRKPLIFKLSFNR